jgi:hypothetical protein
LENGRTAEEIVWEVLVVFEFFHFTRVRGWGFLPVDFASFIAECWCAGKVPDWG